MREKIRLRQYLMTIHADEEMDNDELSIYDVENSILTGEIVEKQKDRETNEGKFLVRGEKFDGSELITKVVKFGIDGTLVILQFMLSEIKEDFCDICGGEAQIKRVTRSYGKGENLLFIENVPIVTCSKCGENYLTAETLHEIARIKLHRKSFAKPRKVAVAEFV